jgi:hypothetical protein
MSDRKADRAIVPVITLVLALIGLVGAMQRDATTMVMICTLVAASMFILIRKIIR